MNYNDEENLYWNAIDLQETFGNKLLFGDLNIFNSDYTKVLIPIYKTNKKRELEFLIFMPMTDSKGNLLSLRKIKKNIKKLLKNIEIEFECDSFKVKQHIEELKYYIRGIQYRKEISK